MSGALLLGNRQTASALEGGRLPCEAHHTLARLQGAEEEVAVLLEASSQIAYENYNTCLACHHVWTTSRKTGEFLRHITNDEVLLRDVPAAALARLLEPTRIQALKAEFDSAHTEGMLALRDGDYDTFGKVILRERQIIDEMFRQRTA